jgi:trimethylamine---corrinoid protein Co-methyltransferase
MTQGTLKPYMRFLSDEAMQKIHEQSLYLLENVGMSINHRKALETLAQAGAILDKDSSRVRFPKKLVEDCLKTVPSRIVYGGRVKEHDLIAEVGGEFHSRPLTGGEGYIDLETREWRKVLTRDLVEWITLADGLDQVDYVASIYPDDMNLDTRDVHILRLMLDHSVKHVEVQPYTGKGVSYMVEMIKAVQGSNEEVKQRPLLSVLTSALAPLKFLPYALDILFTVGPLHVPIELNTMPITGATCPVTLAGAILQANVEILAGVCISQSAFPGMPLMYAPRNLILDSWTGLALQGRMEAAMMSACQTQLAVELYKMPANVFGAVADSMISDTQSATERVLNMLLPVLSGANVLAGLGHIEHCYTYDPILLVMDNDTIGMIRRLMRGVEVNDDTLGVEAITRVAAEGNFLIDPHTLKYYKTEYYVPKAINRFVRGVWESKGMKDANELARERARKILAEHRAEPLDPKLSAELDRIVASADKAAAEGKLSHEWGGASGPDEYGSYGALVDAVAAGGKKL